MSKQSPETWPNDPGLKPISGRWSARSDVTPLQEDATADLVKSADGSDGGDTAGHDEREGDGTAGHDESEGDGTAGHDESESGGAAGRGGEIRQSAADAAAEFGAAADEVDDAAAGLLGVNRTDLRILGLVSAAGAMTAGVLAVRARLSPAATTAAIQRLAAAGHLRRDVDPADRRRAVVRVTAEASAMLDLAYGPIAEAGHRLLTAYSPAELTLIVDFLRVGRRMQLDQAARIRAAAASREERQAGI
ncbi:MarR family transcriptional regulator [Actinoplanes sp. NPDC051861]|uniref:MarR family winged helix-turn-helix transcriptional regulator n=1 Tax=Actinoplanes sp. NPDC051861 TaxID=3155170 RepID=UPI0034355364